VIDSNTDLSSTESTQLVDLFSQDNEKIKVLRENKIAGKAFELMSTRIRKKDKYTEKDLHGISKRCDWFIDEVNLIKKTEVPKTIFLSTKSFLSFGFFVDELLPNLKEDFVLIIGSEDSTFPIGDKECRKMYMTPENRKRYHILKENRYLKCCFVENLDRVGNTGLHPLPTGILPYKEKIFPLKKVSFKNRSLKAVCIHKGRQGPQWKDCHKVTGKCKNEWKGFIDYKETCRKPEFLNLLKKYSFCVCVHGGGIDPSPKAWEALAMGCIPIIQHSTLDEAYSRFPVAFVDSWDENSITKEKLRKWRSELSPRFTNPELRAKVLEMLGVDYWWEIIQEKLKPKKELLGQDKNTGKVFEFMSTRIQKQKDCTEEDLHGISKRCDWFINDLVLLKKKEVPKTIFMTSRNPSDFAFFVNELLPTLNEDFVLILGSSDQTFPAGDGDSRSAYMTLENLKLYPTLMKNKYLKGCFAENLDRVGRGLHPLPLGVLPYKDVDEVPPLEKVELKTRSLKALCIQREREGAQWKDRLEVTKKCKNEWKKFVDYKAACDRPEFLNLLKKYSFCVCVHGGGIDPSPKAWEALAMGCIPIIQHSTLDEAYSRFPVAFVNSWGKKSLTKEKLQKWQSELGPRFTDPKLRAEVVKMLGVEYWWDIILSKLNSKLEVSGDS
jgi:hypothetical protein